MLETVLAKNSPLAPGQARRRRALGSYEEYAHKVLQRMILAAMVLTSLLLAVGCAQSGLERASIRGQVTIDGEPVEAGTIRLVSLEPGGAPSVGGQILDGQYEIRRQQGPSLGKHRVEVRVPYRTGRKVRSPFVMPPVDPNEKPDPSGMVDEWAEKAPARYNTESTLEVTIQSGRNTFDIDIESRTTSENDV